MSDHADTIRQESARRIGICLNDAELFWWRADDDEPCPVCSVADDDYSERHRFYCAEAENQRLRNALQQIAQAQHIEWAQALREHAAAALAAVRVEDER